MSLITLVLLVLILFKIVATTPIAPTVPYAKPRAAEVSPVPVCSLKTDIMLVIDRSSTMTETDYGKIKMEWAKEAATAFVSAIEAMQNIDSLRIGVDSFGAQGNDGTGTRPADRNSTLDSPLTSDFTALKTAISQVHYIQSGTCIECGLRIANDQFITSTADKKVIILISDGMANTVWNGTNNGALQAAIDAANSGRTTYGIRISVLVSEIRQPIK